MDVEKKTKMILCGEFLLFALVFAVLSALILTRVWVLGQSGFRYVFIFITMAGTAWFFVDFFWTLFSKKRRAKNSLLDKVLPLPATGSIFALDVVSLVIGLEASKDIHQLTVGVVFAYLAIMYLFQGFYRYKHPSPLMVEAIEEARKEEKDNKIVLEGQEKEEDDQE